MGTKSWHRKERNECTVMFAWVKEKKTTYTPNICLNSHTYSFKNGHADSFLTILPLIIITQILISNKLLININ